MSKEYNNEEAGGKAELSEKLKGKTDREGASFKPFTNPDGGGDDSRWDGFGEVKSGVSMPQDSEKHLPKAGKGE